MKGRQRQRQRSREKRPRHDNNHHTRDTRDMRQHTHTHAQKHSRPERTDRPERVRFRRDFKQAQKIEILPDVNRSEVCPFLARIYYAINNSNAYDKQTNLPKDRELILYLWMNSTLKQITELLRAHLPVIRTKQRFVFSKISNQNDKLVKTEMGTVLVHKKGMDKQESRLDQHKFNIGDYIDVSINYK